MYESKDNKGGYMYLEIKRKLFWYIRIKSSNGQILLTSETYFNKANCIRATRKLSKALNMEVKQ